MNIIMLLILEKVFESLYFSIFLIFGKKLQEKRTLLIIMMLLQYLFLKKYIHFNIWFQLLYIILAYVDLKVLYKEKSQITDLFLIGLASLILTVISIICALFTFYVLKNYLIGLIINRLLLIVILLLLRNKINIGFKKFNLHWNKRKDKTKIKSLTLRNISIILFNVMFYILNICMAIAVL